MKNTALALQHAITPLAGFGSHTTMVYIILLLLACLSNTPNSYALEKPTVPYYFLSVEANNLHARILLNQAALVAHDSGSGLNTDKPVFNWLSNGENQLDIELYALPEHEQLAGDIHVRLYLHDDKADTPTPKTLLAEYRYPEAEQPPKQPGEKFHAHSARFNFADSIPFKLWQDASKIDVLTKEDKQAIIVTINRLRQALVNGEADIAAKLQAYKITDDALAEGKQAQDIFDITKMNYAWLASQGPLTATELTLDNARFDLCGNNQLVAVSFIDGGNAIQLSSKDMAFEIPIFMSKISNKWRISR